MKERDVTKLPKWAQEKIRHIEIYGGNGLIVKPHMSNVINVEVDKR